MPIQTLDTNKPTWKSGSKSSRKSAWNNIPGVTRIYTATDSGGYGNIRIIVSSREHIGPVMEQVELAGVPFNIAQVLLDSPWHR